MFQILKSGIITVLLTVSATAFGGSQSLDVPITVAAQGDLDTCGVGTVHGLNPDGDNFLAVRSGPGTRYRLIDKLYTGDQVWMFSEQGDWVGIVYASDDIACSPIAADKLYDGPGRRGWVHRKYVRLIAG